MWFDFLTVLSTWWQLMLGREWPPWLRQRLAERGEIRSHFSRNRKLVFSQHPPNEVVHFFSLPILTPGSRRKSITSTRWPVDPQTTQHLVKNDVCIYLMAWGPFLANALLHLRLTYQAYSRRCVLVRMWLLLRFEPGKSCVKSETRALIPGSHPWLPSLLSWLSNAGPTNLHSSPASIPDGGASGTPTGH